MVFRQLGHLILTKCGSVPVCSVWLCTLTSLLPLFFILLVFFLFVSTKKMIALLMIYFMESCSFMSFTSTCLSFAGDPSQVWLSIYASLSWDCSGYRPLFNINLLPLRCLLEIGKALCGPFSILFSSCHSWSMLNVSFRADFFSFTPHRSLFLSADCR